MEQSRFLVRHRLTSRRAPFQARVAGGCGHPSSHERRAARPTRIAPMCLRARATDSSDYIGGCIREWITWGPRMSADRAPAETFILTCARFFKAADTPDVTRAGGHAPIRMYGPEQAAPGTARRRSGRAGGGRTHAEWGCGGARPGLAGMGGRPRGPERGGFGGRGAGGRAPPPAARGPRKAADDWCRDHGPVREGRAKAPISCPRSRSAAAARGGTATAGYPARRALSPEAGTS